MQDPKFVQALFSRIAKRYDIANVVLSGGIDALWRRATARRVASHNPRLILDLACGSGALFLAIKRALPQATIIGGDFCEPLLREAARKGCAPLVVADGMNLPFAEATFDAVTVAFGLRNMASYPDAVREMGRVLKRGGRLHVLDFSLPSNPLIRPLYRLYLHHALPRLAGMMTGAPDAYEYLGGSIEAFPSGKAMCDLFLANGFSGATATPHTMGIATHYEGIKP